MATTKRAPLLDKLSHWWTRSQNCEKLTSSSAAKSAELSSITRRTALRYSLSKETLSPHTKPESAYDLSQMISLGFRNIQLALEFNCLKKLHCLSLKLPLKLIFFVLDSESNLEFYLTKSIFSPNRILSVNQVFTKTLKSLVSKTNISCPNEQFS